MAKYKREAGKRMKRWELGGDATRLIEGTREYPIMYRNLGTEPQNGHPYNLFGDIESQGSALRETISINKEVIPTLAEKILDKGYKQIIGQGLGTSQFVAQTASGAFRSYAKMNAWDLDSLEYVNYRPPLDFKDTVLIAYSGSGSTVDSNRTAKIAKEQGAYQIAITSIQGSPITKKCDDTILCAGGFDTGGSDTFHYTTRLAVSVWLAMEIGARRFPKEREWDALREQFFAVPDQMDGLFEIVAERSRKVSAEYKDIRAILIVGGGTNEGTAEEFALKYDEMSHIPSKAMCPGRHIHGALGLTDHRILTIILAPLKDESYDALRDIARVTLMLKGPSIGIISENDEQIAQLVDDVFRLPVEDPVLFSIPAILPGQLLPYFAGVAQDSINPDCQRADIPRHAKVWNWLFPKDTH